MSDDPRSRLVALLQLAYSGELAAARAYAGHAASVWDARERDEIRAIEDEELAHRASVGELLASLGAAPSPRRERVMGAIGSVLGTLCHVTGWLLPMYGAARLETKNVKEYDDAAALATASGHPEMVEHLLAMADVELAHERYFKAKVIAHRLGRHLPLPRCTRQPITASQGLAS